MARPVLVERCTVGGDRAFVATAGVAVDGQARASARLLDAENAVAALGAFLAGSDLADAFQHGDRDAYFLRPGKRPRTVCGAQPVASTTCATVAPSERRSRASTACCLVPARGERGAVPTEGFYQTGHLLPGYAPQH